MKDFVRNCVVAILSVVSGVLLWKYVDDITGKLLEDFSFQRFVDAPLSHQVWLVEFLALGVVLCFIGLKHIAALIALFRNLIFPREESQRADTELGLIDVLAVFICIMVSLLTISYVLSSTHPSATSAGQGHSSIDRPTLIDPHGSRAHERSNGDAYG